MPKGQCHCGAVRYEMSADTVHRALCHCRDCRRHAGAPMVAWGLVGKDQLKVDGETREYASSEHGRRHFCPKCGTGLFYTNEQIFSGQVDVQTATLDDPDAITPSAQIQVADRIGWMERLDEMAQFDRYPGARLDSLGMAGSQRFRGLFPISPLSTGLVPHFSLGATRRQAHCHQVIGTAVPASPKAGNGKRRGRWPRLRSPPAGDGKGARARTFSEESIRSPLRTSREEAPEEMVFPFARRG